MFNRQQNRSSNSSSSSSSSNNISSSSNNNISSSSSSSSSSNSLSNPFADFSDAEVERADRIRGRVFGMLGDLDEDRVNNILIGKQRALRTIENTEANNQALAEDVLNMYMSEPDNN